jgi:hypothetical protein
MTFIISEVNDLLVSNKYKNKYCHFLRQLLRHGVLLAIIETLEESIA